MTDAPLGGDARRHADIRGSVDAAVAAWRSSSSSSERNMSDCGRAMGPSSEQGIEAFTNAIEQQHDQTRQSAE
jgi:hypothetical protein